MFLTDYRLLMPVSGLPSANSQCVPHRLVPGVCEIMVFNDTFPVIKWISAAVCTLIWSVQSFHRYEVSVLIFLFHIITSHRLRLKPNLMHHGARAGGWPRPSACSLPVQKKKIPSFKCAVKLQGFFFFLYPTIWRGWNCLWDHLF